MADRGLALLDASSVLIVLEEGGELQIAATSGRRARVRGLPVAGSALGALFSAGQAIAVEKPQRSEAAWLEELGLDARAALVEHFTIEPHGAGMIIALREQGKFSDPDRQAVHAFAESLAARMTAERSAEIERLRYGVRMREHERTRWARELHDDTVQGLGALRMQLANARDTGDSEALRASVEKVLGGLEREIVGIRHLITELRPAALDDFGLEAAVEALARRADDLYGLEVSSRIELGLTEDERLDPDVESTIYRVIQEALTNVARHAEATRVVIHVAEREGALEVTVTDNGRGLEAAARAKEEAAERGEADLSTAAGAPGGFGLPGMRERAELVGGELELVSNPAGGATMHLSIPAAARVADHPVG
ncbi:MAG: sensor histidine kinase [Acidobacteriota bacterium]|nr:sensor histidine kinase [Acidobacteriota bacterium]